MPLVNVHKRSGARLSRMHGVALIESLIALLVLALGLLGLAGVQFRLLAENRVSNQRAVAIGLIDDMANRILNNKDQALAGTYSLVWGGVGANMNCAVTLCNKSQLAQADIFAWRSNILGLLPGGNASIFISSKDRRQIGIAVAWSANEDVRKDISASAYAKPFELTLDNSGVACPIGSICHVIYVHP